MQEGNQSSGGGGGSAAGMGDKRHGFDFISFIHIHTTYYCGPTLYHSMVGSGGALIRI